MAGPLPSASDDRLEFECPVTIPETSGFRPPGRYPANPSIKGTNTHAWYGSEELWTVLPADGEHFPRKSVWWSANFPGGRLEQQPPLHVSKNRLDAAEPVVVDNDGKANNAHTPEHGWFMIAGIDPGSQTGGADEAGCWEVTARYKGAILSHVYEVP